MVDRTKSFLSCVSLSSVLALGACGLNDEQTARFSEASNAELSTALAAVTLVEQATILVPILAAFDSLFSENNCPEITPTSIVGNGCEIAGEVRYDGSIELGPTLASQFASMTFREFRRTDAELSSFYMDGTVAFAQEGDEVLRYDLDMVLERQAGFAANVYRAEVDASATCQVWGEASARCTLDAGAAHIDNLGGFTLEGAHSLGDVSDLPEGSSALDVTLHGAETMRMKFDAATGCIAYTIEDGEPQQHCGR